jgi:hypothetical protein
MKNDVFWVVTPCGSCKNLEPQGVTTQKAPFDIEVLNIYGLFYFYLTTCFGMQRPSRVFSK